MGDWIVGCPIAWMLKQLTYTPVTLYLWAKGKLMSSDLPAHEASTQSDREFALKQFDTIVKIITYEGQVFWNRSQLFLVANAAFLGFVIRDLPVGPERLPTARYVILILATFVGILLCVLWHNAVKYGYVWFDWWIIKAKQIERQAFGEITLYTARPNTGSVRRVAKMSVWLFMTVWCVIFIYLSFSLLQFCKH